MTPGLRAVLAGATLLAAGCAGTPVADSSPGRTGSSTLPQPPVMRAAFTLGQRVVHAAEADDAQVALVARVGVDLQRFGVHYSHAGWLWRPSPQDPWRIVHQLNISGTHEARLFETGPATFFMDRLSAPQAVVVVPSAALQQRLLQALASPLPEALRGARYNFFAHPDSATDQNSAAWTAEVLAAALSPPGEVSGRVQAQAALHRHGHQPTRGVLRWYEKLGATLLYPKVIRLSDQPDGDDYHVTSADSLMQLLVTADPHSRVHTIDLRPPAGA